MTDDERRLAETRTVLLFGTLTLELARTASAQLLLQASQSSGPIKLMVNAQGGPLEAAEALFDLIRGVGVPVKAIAAGAVANAAALAYAAPPRDQRYSLPHARFALFQNLGAPPVPGGDVLAAAQWAAQQRARVARLFARQTSQPEELVERDIENRIWLDADEARRYGLVGRIVQGLSEV
ncbi:MAG: ATP-dependent Clp protease proteolytic subunit [Anaerolineales bacterium]|nr:ATP-dependent Clp protease proteolytic subunit [Anaerolineales bacterium]